MGSWKSKTLDECKNELWNKTSQVKNLEDFRDLLLDLADSSFGKIFYLPLAFKFSELYNQIHWRQKLLFIGGLVLGFIFGHVIGSL